jgi:hypothetical protein
VHDVLAVRCCAYVQTREQHALNECRSDH